jgi:hypothetical protein
MAASSAVANNVSISEDTALHYPVAITAVDSAKHCIALHYPVAITTVSFALQCTIQWLSLL